MSQNSRQALVGVLGDTYITLAISDIDELSVSNFALLNTADFESPMQAVERYLKSVPRCPDKVAFAISGTIEGDAARFRHRDWTISRNDVRAATGATHVFLVSDIEAAARMLPHLSRYDTVELLAGIAVPYGNRTVVTCGAGMSSAGLVHSAGAWVPVVGNAGAIAFAPAEGKDADLASALVAEGRSTLDDVFSGQGLVALYRQLAGKDAAGLSGARQIATAGLSGEDPVAARCLEVMAGWLGSMAAEMALLYGARGGLYLAGGLVANIVPALQTGHFERAFLGTGRRADYLSKVPVRVVKMAADAAMRGAALASAEAEPTTSGRRRMAAS